MARRVDNVDSGGSGKGKKAGSVLQKVVEQVAPPSQTYGLRPAPAATNRQAQNNNAANAAASAAAAAESRAKASAKAQSRKENDATQGIIDALMKGAANFGKGRDTLLSNADRALQAALQGTNMNYQSAVSDYMKTGVSNDQDEASKSAANVANRARERTALLEQAASMGAGETDQLRTQLQAFQNFDANQLEITRSFFDTSRSIDSQIQGANSQAMTSRRSAWQQAEEARGNAWNEFYKNYGDAWTNIQRTAAQNSNVDSDYSEAFNARTGKYDPVKEASRYAGSAYTTKDQNQDWYNAIEGRVDGREARSTATSRAASTTIAAPKAAEGATLRRRT